MRDGVVLPGEVMRNVEGFRKELLLQPGERVSCDFKKKKIKIELI